MRAKGRGLGLCTREAAGRRAGGWGRGLYCGCMRGELARGLASGARGRVWRRVYCGGIGRGKGLDFELTRGVAWVGVPLACRILSPKFLTPNPPRILFFSPTKSPGGSPAFVPGSDYKGRTVLHLLTWDFPTREGGDMEGNPEVTGHVAVLGLIPEAVWGDGTTLSWHENLTGQGLGVHREAHWNAKRDDLIEWVRGFPEATRFKCVASGGFEGALTLTGEEAVKRPEEN